MVVTMRKEKFIVGFLLLALAVLSCASASENLVADSSGGFVQIENVSIHEESVWPGSTFHISFTVRNVLKDRLKRLYVRFADSNSFESVGADTFAYPYEMLPHESVQISFTIRAAQELVAGVYSLPFTISSEAQVKSTATLGGGIISTIATMSTIDYASVEIDGDPVLVLSSISMLPPVISAGESGTLFLYIYNNGSDTAKNVQLEIGPSPSENLVISSASTSSFLGELPPRTGASAQASFDVKNTAASDHYTIPALLFFNDYDGQAFEAHHRLNMTLDSSARINVKDVPKGMLIRGANEQPVSVTLVNDGSAVAEDVKCILLAEYPFTAAGRSSYVERISPEGVADVFFSVDVDDDAVSGAQSYYPLELLITYREGEVRKSVSRMFSVQVLPGQRSVYEYVLYIIIPSVFAVLLLGSLFRRISSHIRKKKRKK